MTTPLNGNRMSTTLDPRPILDDLADRRRRCTGLITTMAGF